jgi:hypothetical protein
MRKPIVARHSGQVNEMGAPKSLLLNKSAGMGHLRHILLRHVTLTGL